MSSAIAGIVLYQKVAQRDQDQLCYPKGWQTVRLSPTSDVTSKFDMLIFPGQQSFHALKM